MSQELMCVRAFSDAGTECLDESDCEGECMYEGEGLDAGTAVVGRCQVDDDPCGCFVLVSKGRVGDTVCSD
jgi:hypothetical protein